MKYTLAKWASMVAVLCGLIVLTPDPAKAGRCPPFSLAASPARGATGVPTNVRMFFELSGAVRKYAKAILKGARLVGRGHSVPLDLNEHGSSAHSYSRLYVEVVPRRRLRRNHVYRLVLVRRRPRRGSVVPMMRWITKRFNGYRFTTGAGPDRRVPGRPIRVTTSGHKKQRVSTGYYNLFPLTVTGLKDDRTPVRALRYRLDVRQVRGGQTKNLTLFALPGLKAGRLRFGSVPCSGLFYLRRGARYTVKVRAVDWAGNTSPPSPRITLGPVK